MIMSGTAVEARPVQEFSRPSGTWYFEEDEWSRDLAALYELYLNTSRVEAVVSYFADAPLAQWVAGGAISTAKRHLTMSAPERITRRARAASHGLANRDIGRYALTILDQIGHALEGVGTSGLPDMWAGEAEDKSLLLEWVTSGGRIGFSVEPEIASSSWYIVTNKSLGSVIDHGLLSHSSVSNLIHRFLQYVS